MAKAKQGIIEPDDDGPVTKDEARTGTKHMLAFLNYGGTNPDYLQRAKIAAILVSSYVKHYASQTNRAMLEFTIEQKQSRELPGANNRGRLPA